MGRDREQHQNPAAPQVPITAEAFQTTKEDLHREWLDYLRRTLSGGMTPAEAIEKMDSKVRFYFAAVGITWFNSEITDVMKGWADGR